MSKANKIICDQSHHKKKGFDNTEPFSIKLTDALRWRLQRKVLPPKGGYQAFIQNWVSSIDISLSGDRVWWIGHSTTLIKLNEQWILTDPVFSNRVSPVQFIGPKRRTKPAITIEKLPPINVVVISHSHYDHLDFNSICQLITQFPQITILVPLGLKSKLLKWGAKQVIELDWWQSTNVNGITFNATPAKHWSNRGAFDVNKALWSGWVMQTDIDKPLSTKTVYFMGDTGYCASLKKITDKFKQIDLALIPIGAYAPRWFMQSQHIDPQQAVQLYDELNCQSAIAVHWGAFELADEPLDEPPTLLNSLKKDRAFYILKIGDSLAINQRNNELK